MLMMGESPGLEGCARLLSNPHGDAGQGAGVLGGRFHAGARAQRKSCRAEEPLFLTFSGPLNEKVAAIGARCGTLAEGGRESRTGATVSVWSPRDLLLRGWRFRHRLP